MPDFARSFDIDALARWDCLNPGNAIRALFQRWALPGQPTMREVPLRLGLRDGYINFYVKGQSVAKLTSAGREPKLSVHEAYTIEPANASASRAPAGQRYVSFKADSSSIALIDGWIARAETYASAEKRFVDELIAANAGVLDLEMGLPASDLAGSDRVAPRMDLVVAQVSPGTRPEIVFWEAKCSLNAELRSGKDYQEFDDGGFAGPSVIHQLGKYVRWIGEGGRVDQVRGAYKNAAATLLDLYRLFGPQEDLPECVAIWRAVAASDPAIIVQPGVVVGNYCPEGHRMMQPRRFQQKAASFKSNGHRAKLEGHDIVVHEVGTDDDGPVLPRLKAGRVPV